MNIFTKSLFLIVFLLVYGLNPLSIKAQGTIKLNIEGFYKAHTNPTPALFKVFYSFDSGALAGTEVFCTDVVNANQGYVLLSSGNIDIPYPTNPPNNIKLFVQEWRADAFALADYLTVCGGFDACSSVFCAVPNFSATQVIDFTLVGPGYDSNFDFQIGGSTGMKGSIQYLLPNNPFTIDTKALYKPNGFLNFQPYEGANVPGGHCYGKDSEEFKFVPQIIPVPNTSGILYVWEYSYQVNFTLPTPSTYTSPWIEVASSISEHYVGDIFEMPNLLNDLYNQYDSHFELLKPILTIRVHAKYGPSYSLTTGKYTLLSADAPPTSDINLNYPPSVAKPQVPTFAQNNNAITNFGEAVSENTSVRVEHIKCKKPTEKGTIILKNPQGLAKQYTAYIRNQEGYVANQDMDFRTNPTMTYSFTGLSKGEYELIIENYGTPTSAGFPVQAGCYSESVFVYVNEPATTFSATATAVVKAATGGKHISCFGASDGEITATPSGGVVNYYYKLFKEQGINNWVLIATENNKATAHTFSGLSAGNYRVVIQDVFQTTSCEETKDVTLLEPTQINSSLSGVQQYEDEISGVDYDIKNFGGSQTIFILPTGGSPNYTVTLGATTLPATTIEAASFTLTSGTYPYRIVDATTTCQRNFSVAMTQPLDISLASQNITHVSCNGGSDGLISGTPQGGIRSSNYYTYTLTKPSQAGFSMMDDGIDFSFSGLTAGTYVLEVKDRYATSKTFSFVVNEPTAISMLTNSSHKPFVSCVGGSDGVISLNLSGGIGPYTYRYSVDGGNLSSEQITTGVLTLSGLVAGNYAIEIQDSRKCYNNLSGAYPGFFVVNFTVDAPSSVLSLVLIPEHLLCKGDNSGKIYLSGLGGWGSYTFFDAVTNAPILSNTITGLSAGTYQYKIRDLHGCEQVANITLTEPSELIGSSITASPTLCFGEASGSVSVVVNGGTAPYQISVDGGALQAYSSGNTITGLLAGSHTLRLVDANACEKTYNFSISDAPQINISTLSQTPANCGATDGAVSVAVSGGTGAYTYTWRNSSNVVVGTNSSTLTSVSSGTYTVTIKDANNCEKQYVAIVPSADGPIGVVSVVQTISCFGGNDGVASISITQGTAPYSVLWSNGQTSTNVTTTATMSGLVGGSQIAQITDAAGCIQPITFSISQPASAVGINTTSIVEPTCNGGSNGMITIVGTGGTAPYSYLWLDDNSTLSTRVSLKAGSYSVQITDSKGCKITQAITLTEPSPVSANFSESSFTICPNQTLSLDAGNTGSSYVWKKAGTTVSTSQQTLITEAGDYELVITTPAGCVGTKTFSVNISNDALKAEFLAATEIEVGDTLVAIDVTNPAPSEVVWSYDVSNPAINRIDNQSIPYYAYFTFSEAGTYVITMQVKLFGCASTLQKTIRVKPKSGRVANTGLGYQGVGEISKLLVYPNPSGGVFQTKVELVKESSVEILLYGLQNRESYFRQSLSGAKEYNVEVNLPYLPAGNYVLVVKTPQMTKTQQIVISK
ncbi:hypothetical protein AD998_21415 [bacterium 336/3]|nr:hypothetical protein AD998_21415 [bacterium 336/3]